MNFRKDIYMLLIITNLLQDQIYYNEKKDKEKLGSIHTQKP